MTTKICESDGLAFDLCTESTGLGKLADLWISHHSTNHYHIDLSFQAGQFIDVQSDISGSSACTKADVIEVPQVSVPMAVFVYLIIPSTMEFSWFRIDHCRFYIWSLYLPAWYEFSKSKIWPNRLVLPMNFCSQFWDWTINPQGFWIFSVQLEVVVGVSGGSCLTTAILICAGLPVYCY